MKSVGKQLQAARLAKNWTPELAARETKIKVDRLRDLEADDYSHFTSPAYARGFVRTYARSLGLDEYAILRQLDNKLPDDDTPNLVSDSNVGYLPETAMPPRVAHRDYTGLYVVLTLGCVVVLIFAFVLFQAYRVGELPRYFAGNNSDATDSGNTTNTTSDATARALPVDPNAAPPAVADTATTNTPPVALPVDPSALSSVATTNAAPNSDVPAKSVRALPVDPSELTNAPAATTPAPNPVTVTSAQELVSADTKVPPRALPVDLNATNAVTAAPAPAPAPTPVIIPAISGRQSNSGPVKMPAPLPTPAAAITATSLTATGTPTASTPGKRLVLTASQDSFVRVTSQDSPDSDKPLYASVLHAGQSIGFDGRKFSINVGVPSAVDIKLDDVNYGPHSDQETPETFTVESHQP